MHDALTLFIGSPSDVPDERKIVLDVAQDVDARIARHLGLSLRALGFEHVLPGLGRPQELINPDVDTCDVFVGIVNVRWGTPTGDHSSGFEEELERVKARHERGDAVAVLLYLRQLEDESQAEPAMQAFRERIRTEALIRWFTDRADFRTQLQTDLAQLLAQRSGELLRAAREDAAQATARLLPQGAGSGELPAAGDTASNERGATQAHVALGRFAAGDDEALVRAHLAVSARMSSRLTGATLDVHDVNRLYEYRDQIEPTAEEQSLLVRTACAHGVTAAVWGLLNHEDEDALVWLTQVLLDDREANIRAGAAAELGPAGINELVDTVVACRGVPAEDVFRRLLSDEASEVRRVVIEALATSGRGEAEGILHGLLGNDIEPVLVFERLGMLLVERDATDALDHAVTTPTWVKQDFLDALRARADDLDRDRLIAMLDGNASTKVLALQLLAARSDDLPEVQALVVGGSLKVRRAAVATLTERRVVLDPEQVDGALKDESSTPAFRALTGAGPTDEELRRQQFALRSPDERALHVNWTELRGGDALAAAVVAGDDGAAHLARRSLGDELAQVREEHIQIAISQRHELVVREIADRYGDLMDHLWIQGALAGLADADNHQSEDADLAIRHLDRAMRRDDAARLLARTGTAEHVRELINAANGIHTEKLRCALLKRAVEQAGPEPVLQEVIAAETGERGLRTLLIVVAENGYEIPQEALLPHLLNSENGVRRAALRLMTQGLEPDGLAQLLDELASTSPRYYDIVGILDRMVHGPTFVRARARTVLEDA